LNTLAIVGGGSWGTALAIALSARFAKIRLLIHEPDLARTVADTRENPVYLSGFHLPGHIEALSGYDAQGAGLILGVMPSRFARAAYSRLQLDPGVPIVSATKGIERGSLLRMSQVIAETVPGHPVAVLSGPTFAREIAKGDPAAVVIASQDTALAALVQQTLRTPQLRFYTNEDVTGVEIGASLKNVIAIAAGVVEGLGLGNNTKAALITRGLAEITRLAVAAGGQTKTLAGLAGLGDLVLTCTGSLSRNRAVGIELAAGKSLPEITAATPMVAEGIETTEAALQLAAKLGVEVPIAAEVGRILQGECSPADAIRGLMDRSPKHE
jgi:glycerol-3-phosphate dehydrogenase (NAD(P)+)